MIRALAAGLLPILLFAPPATRPSDKVIDVRASRPPAGNTFEALWSVYKKAGAKGDAEGAQNALRETEEAIAQVLETSAPIELSPQSAYIRRLQHQLAEQHNLASRSTGKEPYRRVRISKAD